MSWLTDIFKKKNTPEQTERWVVEFNEAQIEKDVTHAKDRWMGVPGKEIWSLQRGYHKMGWEKGAMEWHTTKRLRYWKGPKPDEEGEEISKKEFEVMKKRYDSLYR